MNWEERDRRGYDSRLARRLLSYLSPYRGLVAAAVLLLLAVSALQLAGPYLTKVAIDGPIRDGEPEGLLWIALLFLLVLLTRFVLGYLQTYWTQWIGQQIMSDLRGQLFRHLQKLDAAYFDRTPAGRIITRITNDVDVLNELFTSGVVSVFGDLFSLAGIVAIMLWLNWKLALVSFAVIPLLFLATLVFKLKVRDSYRRVRRAVAAINAFLQESFTGMSVIQMFVQEDRKRGEFETLNRAHMQANLDSIFYYAVFYPLVNLLGAVAVALILWVGGIQVLDGALTLGAVVAFVQYAERFYKPISDLSEKVNILQSAMASSERIFELLDTQPAIVPPATPERDEVRGRIEFDRVDFWYREGTPVLRDVSLTVEPGEKVAIVGATGSGKTTLISLLCRFYDVQEGAVRIDGVDVRQHDLDQLRRSIAIVLQDVFLFNGTIADNVRLWGSPISRQRLEQATRRVSADRFVARLPQGYDSPVRERGSVLSAGQRQLLAFARALAHDPRILVLDEATSSVDTETELLIQDALRELMQERTSLIIAHRLSTIQHCDRIVVLHKGEVREQGTHRELLGKRGIYFKLYQLQYKEQLAGAVEG